MNLIIIYRTLLCFLILHILPGVTLLYFTSMDDMTIKKDPVKSRLAGADLSKSFPGALYSPSTKPDPIPHPPPKRLSLLSATDDDLQPLSWLVSPNLLHNVCGRPQHTKPPPPKRLIPTTRPTGRPAGRFSMMGHFKLSPSPRSCDRNIKSIRTITLPRIIKTEAPAPRETHRQSLPRHHPYKLHTRFQDHKPLRSKYAKPPYSFATLIFMAIEDSPVKKLPVKDIYSWILDRLEISSF